MSIPTLNADRFRDDFEALAKIGSTGDGGVNRPTFSKAHLEARAWFRNRIQAARLQARVDGAGNHSAFLKSAAGDAQVILIGSHLDSVPYGGRFDGALGVLAALEVLRAVQESGISLAFDLEAIDFTDEEGSISGLMGSSAVAGTLTQEELKNPRGGRDALLEGLTRAGLTEESLLSARRDPATLAGYLELHIEQGPRLESSGTDIGIVNGIVGLVSYQLSFHGQADHAGTTSMQDRRDAAQGACSFAVRVRNLLMDQFPGCVANVGSIQLLPGAFNIIPGTAIVSLEFRAPQTVQLKELETALLELAQEEAGRFDLVMEIQPRGVHLPVPMSSEVQAAIARSAEKLGLKSIHLPSGAGHDAQVLASICPAGMIFVPSTGGASHNSNEFTEWEDCLNGAQVLLQTVLELAGV